MIKTARFYHYKNSMVLTFIANHLELLNTHNIAALDTSKTDLQSAYEQMAQSFKRDTGSVKTDNLKALDERRDDAIRGITLVADGFEYHPDTVKSNAGEAILRSIRKYAKNIIRLSYQEETAIIRDLIANWTNDATLAAAITTLGLTDWQTELAEANNAFDTLYVARNQESAQKLGQVPTSELRKAVETQFQSLVQIINANALLNPSETLNLLVAEMNSTIDKYNTETARRGRTNSEESTDGLDGEE